MTAYVSNIRSADSGLGQFQRGEEYAVSGDWDSLEEYADHITTHNKFYSYATDPDIAAMGDEDGELLAAKLREVNGAVIGGHDALVAYYVGPNYCGDREVIVESVRLV